MAGADAFIYEEACLLVDGGFGSADTLRIEVSVKACVLPHLNIEGAYAHVSLKYACEGYEEP